MKNKTILLATAAMLVTTLSAHAEDKTKGLYGSIGAGYTFQDPNRDLDVATPLDNGIPVAIFDSEFDYSGNVAIVGAVGYDWGNSWRTELEFGYRGHTLQDLAGDGPGFAGFPNSTITDGDLDTYSIFANALYDFDFITDAGQYSIPAIPYVGAGVGVTIADISVDANNPNSPGGFDAFTIDDSQNLFSVQGIAGVAVPVSERLLLDISYRYIATTKRNFDGTLNGAAIDANTNANSHNILASLRWYFAPAAAAVAPVAAAAIQYKDCWDGSQVPLAASCPPELVEQISDVPDPIQVTVYFDFDKSNLTNEASNLINEAVSRASNFDYDTVTVVGNTDRSGSSAYNQALSERRARVVRDALIARGIPASAIRSNALGESNPARTTEDGVREPLNRRTNITINFE